MIKRCVNQEINTRCPLFDREKTGCQCLNLKVDQVLYQLLNPHYEQMELMKDGGMLPTLFSN